ncbi:hypothetical protein RRF57_005845 [Xylaria bambusicola]|uniref:Uncharacterized protein n=1 Tax=Xylaria bambusicola TaxID=326684 RepID=A0AAN7UMT3_9PEZI
MKGNSVQSHSAAGSLPSGTPNHLSTSGPLWWWKSTTATRGIKPGFAASPFTTASPSGLDIATIGRFVRNLRVQLKKIAVRDSLVARGGTKQSTNQIRRGSTTNTAVADGPQWCQRFKLGVQ